MKLIIEDDEGRRTVIPFAREEITIGREEGNTIRLTERNVSRRHARLVRQNGHILIEDLGSSYGIQLNGERLSALTPFKDGDLVQIGDYDLALQPDDADDDEPTALRGQPAPSDDEEADEDEASESLEAAEDDDSDHQAEPTQVDDEVDRKATVPVMPVTPVVSPAVSSGPESRGRQSTAVISLDAITKASEANAPAEDLEPDEAPRLVVLNTPLAGREFACIRTVLRIGRTDENDVTLDHPSLSRTHAKLVREPDGEWKIVDLQSANGVRLNGEKYGRAPLASGDILELGHVKLKFLGPGVAFRFDPRLSYEPKPPGGKRSKTGLVVVLALLLLGGAGGYFWWSRHHGSALVVATRTHRNAPAPVAEAPSSPNEAPAPVDHQEAPASPTAEAQPSSPEAPRTAAAPKNPSPPSAHPDAVAQEVEAPTAAPDEAAPPQEKPAAKAPSRPHRTSDVLSEARAALRAGNPDHAHDLLAALPRRVRSESKVRRLERQVRRAVAQQKAARARKAAQAEHAKELANRKKKTDALFAQAKSLLSSKHATPSDTLQAKSLLTQCVHLNPKHADCHMLLGTAFAKLGDSATAADHYRKFVQYADLRNPFDAYFVPRVKVQLSKFNQEQP